MIEVKNLTKNYGRFEAVKDVSFSVGHTEVLGFLGPNGAGKTTIMKILTGYHFPSRGIAKIDGISVEDDPVEVKQRIGYLPENVPLYGDLSPEDYLYFAASARLLPKGQRQEAVDKAICLCGLEGYRTRRIDTLSKGYRQRVGLAQAIIHDPPILILDEPTSGLDPNQIIEIRSLIGELGKRKTVILSTHILSEVEAVCTRVLILNEGRIAAQGSPAEIAGTVKGAGWDTWELHLKGTNPEELPQRLARLDTEIREVKTEGLENQVTGLSFKLPGAAGDTDYFPQGERIFDWAVSQGYKIISMTRKKPTLEETFVKLTSEERGSKPLTSEVQGREPPTAAERNSEPPASTGTKNAHSK